MARLDPLAAKPPPVFPQMRIGLLGGSFNPAHEGHLHISLTVLQRLDLDQIWWLVTPGNPLKSHDRLPDLADRVATACAMAAHPRIRVTGFEAEQPSPFAVDTVAFLRRRYPGTRFVWIAGGDILRELHRWRAWPRLFHMLPMVFLDRPGERHAAMASPAAQRFSAFRVAEAAAQQLPFMTPPAWAYLSLPLSYLSSTALRGAG